MKNQQIDSKYLLSLKNKAFASEIFEYLEGRILNPKDLEILTNHLVANEILGNISRANRVKKPYQYAFIKEYHKDDDAIINGHRRYYKDLRFRYDGKSYLITNDWYLPTNKHIRDNKTPFIEWVKSL
ncbi:hypothetical protein CCY99_08890 [Helicobacter sp. 16-1353]|uniref:hypothetical protein n=1 Tax=Helicobacter sp. 16-1353 TaxID=2004996 RepID=UPI000DCC6EBF|nr:hypothetical protein [Helicobacter sp. 16-1353]RAX51567.1 hypothetical protein CCY99_08890 [Helicobacter sp. 16-1353]